MYLNFELSRDVFTMNQLEIILPRVSSWYRTPVVLSVSPRICVKTTCVWTPTWWDFDSSHSFFFLDLNILHCFIKLFELQLRVVAYDTSVSRLRATAECYITVRRNLNGPIFNPSTYEVTIREELAVNTYIQKLNVSDPDGVRTENHLSSLLFPNECVTFLKGEWRVLNVYFLWL